MIKVVLFLDYLMDCFLSLILALPVFRAAILPTFAPGGALRETVELCPTC
jgi:hypothetical protein